MIIDAHAYVGESIYWRRKFEAEDLIKRMDKNGISMAVVTAPPPGPDYQAANKKVYEAVKKYPDRLIGIYRANPWFKEKELERVKIAIKDWGFKGIKLDPQNDAYSAISPLVKPFIELAEKLDVPVYVRTANSQFCPPEAVVFLASTFPNVTVITKHTPLGISLASKSPMAEKLKNLIFGTHPLRGAHQGIDRFLKGLPVLFDPKRVVFTTEVPFGYPELELKTIELTGLDEEIKRLILSENIKRVLKL